MGCLWKRRLIASLWASGAMLGGAPSEVFGQSADPLFPREERLRFTSEGPGWRVTSPWPQGELELSPHPVSLRSPAFRLLTAADGSALREVEAPPGRMYRGVATTSAGETGVACARWVEGNFEARVYWDSPQASQITWFRPLDPAIAKELDDKASHEIVQETWEDMVASDCGISAGMNSLGVSLAGEWRTETPRWQGSSGRSSVTAGEVTTLLTELAIDSDHEYFLRNGADVEACLVHAEWLIHQVDTIYRREVGIAYEWTVMIVRPKRSTDPYLRARGPDDMLFMLRDHWNDPDHEEHRFPRDVVHGMTGKERHVLGQGFIGVVCETAEAYSTHTAFLERTKLFAHELGHNWGCSHCSRDDDCNIMRPSVSSGGTPRFGSRSRASIRAHRVRNDCFEFITGPTAVPFFDGFENDLIPVQWSYTRGARIVSEVDDAPSGSHALELKANGPGLYDSDELRSNRIRLGLLDHRIGEVYLTFFARSSGLESDEGLRVEYFAADRLWKSLALFPGEPTDAWTFHRRAIPSDGFHNDFRLRWTVLGDDPDDRFRLDDVTITLGGISRTADSLVPGGKTRVRFFGAEPHESPLWLLASLQGVGGSACLPGGDSCIELLDPLWILDIGTADSQGLVDFCYAVPRDLPSDFSIALQGLLPRFGGTPVLSLPIRRKASSD